MDTLNSGESAGSIRNKINSNFAELSSFNFSLSTSNITPYTANKISSPANYSVLSNAELFVGYNSALSVLDFVISPDGSKLYVLKSDGGLYFSLNGGVSWTLSYSPEFQPNSSIIPKIVPNFDFSEVAIDYRNSDSIYNNQRSIAAYNSSTNSWRNLYQYSGNSSRFSANGDFSQVFKCTNIEVFITQLNIKKYFPNNSSLNHIINDIETSQDGSITIVCLGASTQWWDSTVLPPTISRDNGLTWQYLPVPANRWLGVRIASNSKSIILWTENLIYSSNDSGISWTNISGQFTAQVQQNYSSRIKSVNLVTKDFSNFRSAYLTAITANNKCYISYNFGQTWNLTAINGVTRLYAVKELTSNNQLVVYGQNQYGVTDLLTLSFDSPSLSTKFSSVITTTQSNSANWLQNQETIFSQFQSQFLPKSGGTITQTLDVTGNAFFNQSPANYDTIRTSNSKVSLKKFVYDFGESKEALDVVGGDYWSVYSSSLYRAVNISNALLTNSISIVDEISELPNLYLSKVDTINNNEYLTNKLEIFNLSGTSEGFVPLYSPNSFYI